MSKTGLRVSLYLALACCEVGIFVEAMHGHVFAGPAGFALLIVAAMLFPGWCRTRPKGLADSFRIGPPPDAAPDPARHRGPGL